jgi:hypothetical protein
MDPSEGVTWVRISVDDSTGSFGPMELRNHPKNTVPKRAHRPMAHREFVHWLLTNTRAWAAVMRLTACVSVCPPTGPVPIKQEIKQEPESSKMGPANTRTPLPKPCAARTPSAKAAPAATSIVSPTVQLEVKLLPAVHAQAAEGGRVAGCAPGLPKPRPPGAAQTKQAQAAAAAAAATAVRAMTPEAADLTEEECRNVYAIQTSPYVAQVKPRTPGMPTAGKPIFTSYMISPYRYGTGSTYVGAEGSKSRVGAHR